MAYTRSPIQWQHCLKVSLYTFLLVHVQALWVSRLPYPALRGDLLLPLLVGVAMEWPPVASLLWAFVWGFVMDTFSGKFWGFHVGSYVVAVCMVNIATEKFEFQNPLYQMAFVGLCALGQSLVLGLYLLFEPSETWVLVNAAWRSLAVRSVMITILGPLLIYPLCNEKKSFF